METFFTLLYNTIATPSFILTAIVLSFSVKIYLLKLLIPQGLRPSTIQKPLLFLLCVLLGSMFGDIAWIIKLLRKIIVTDIPYSSFVFLMRISWALLVVQYQSLALFIESLTEKKFTLSWFHKISAGLSASLFLYFLYTAFFDPRLTDSITRHAALAKALHADAPLEIRMMQFTSLFLIFLTILSLFLTYARVRSNHLPKILRKQLKVFIVCLITPYLASEIILCSNLVFKVLESYLHPVVGFSIFLITCAIYHCIRKVLGLRFLDPEGHVQSRHRLHFIKDFKPVLEQLSHATSLQELGSITQTFFKNAFNAPLRHINLYIRTTNEPGNIITESPTCTMEKTVENFVRNANQDVEDYLYRFKIFIRDEI